MSEPTLAEAITAFEKRMKASPTLRDALQFPEYAAMIRAIVKERFEPGHDRRTCNAKEKR